MGYSFRQFTAACPEQWVIGRGDRAVAYLRVRSGEITVRTVQGASINDDPYGMSVGDVVYFHKYEDDTINELAGRPDERIRREEICAALDKLVA